MSKLPASRATLPLGDALAGNETLASLLARVQESQARYESLRAELPAGLATLVRPGPLDDSGWTLLVPSGAAAAKLRQSLPRLEAVLAAKGWALATIRIKVLVTPA